MSIQNRVVNFHGATAVQSDVTETLDVGGRVASGVEGFFKGIAGVLGFFVPRYDASHLREGGLKGMKAAVKGEVTEKKFLHIGQRHAITARREEVGEAPEPEMGEAVEHEGYCYQFAPSGEGIRVDIWRVEVQAPLADGAPVDESDDSSSESEEVEENRYIFQGTFLLETANEGIAKKTAESMIRRKEFPDSESIVNLVSKLDVEVNPVETREFEEDDEEGLNQEYQGQIFGVVFDAGCWKIGIRKGDQIQVLSVDALHVNDDESEAKAIAAAQIFIDKGMPREGCHTRSESVYERERKGDYDPKDRDSLRRFFNEHRNLAMRSPEGHLYWVDHRTSSMIFVPKGDMDEICVISARNLDGTDKSGTGLIRALKTYMIAYDVIKKDPNARLARTIVIDPEKEQIRALNDPTRFVNGSWRGSQSTAHEMDGLRLKDLPKSLWKDVGRIYHVPPTPDAEGPGKHEKMIERVAGAGRKESYNDYDSDSESVIEELEESDESGEEKLEEVD